MAELLQDKTSLDQFTDRELLLTILAHQVKIFRQLEYLEQRVTDGKINSLGPDYTASIEKLTQDNAKSLKEFDQYLTSGANYFSE
jgi:hypothetical protein